MRTVQLESCSGKGIARPEELLGREVDREPHLDLRGQVTILRSQSPISAPRSLSAILFLPDPCSSGLASQDVPNRGVIASSVRQNEGPGRTLIGPLCAT